MSSRFLGASRPFKTTATEPTVMHFDPRTQQALQDVGLTQDEIETVSEQIVDTVVDDADRLGVFFDASETVYSDMETAHSTESIQTHTVEFLDLYTHAADMRGYLRFENWGVPVEGGRILNDDVVELTLGETINGRVRFAHDRAALE